MEEDIVSQRLPSADGERAARPDIEPAGAFTPGPWRAIGHMGIVTRDATAPYPADHTGNVEICRVGDWRDRELIPFNGERWTADARLIAAAPDLLETLSGLVCYGCDIRIGFTDPDSMRHVRGCINCAAPRAAIAKALGGAS